MNLLNPSATLLVPDSTRKPDALLRTTHLGIGAHQDDLEFMAFHGIAECYDDKVKWFGGVACTDGSGSVRTGTFAGLSDEEMSAIRRKEQDEAARIGHYSFIAQLGYPSSHVKDPDDGQLAQDLHAILLATQPKVVYTHNPADKHPSHIGVLASVLEALRKIPPDDRPEKLLGCEIWRDLDWMLDEDKVLLDVSGYDELAECLNKVFASQVMGGKRYDLAVIGRRYANATFLEAHETDQAEQLCVAMDLTPLMEEDSLSVADHVNHYMARFSGHVMELLDHHLRE